MGQLFVVAAATLAIYCDRILLLLKEKPNRNAFQLHGRNCSRFYYYCFGIWHLEFKFNLELRAGVRTQRPSRSRGKTKWFAVEIKAPQQPEGERERESNSISMLLHFVRDQSECWSREREPKHEAFYVQCRHNSNFSHFVQTNRTHSIARRKSKHALGESVSESKCNLWCGKQINTNRQNETKIKVERLKSKTKEVNESERENSGTRHTNQNDWLLIRSAACSTSTQVKSNYAMHSTTSIFIFMYAARNVLFSCFSCCGCDLRLSINGDPVFLFRFILLLFFFLSSFALPTWSMCVCK